MRKGEERLTTSDKGNGRETEAPLSSWYHLSLQRSQRIISSFIKAKIAGSKHEELEISTDTGQVTDCTAEEVFAVPTHYTNRAKSSPSNEPKKSSFSC